MKTSLFIALLCLAGSALADEWLARSFVEDFGMPREKVHVVGAGINMEFPPEVDRDFSRPRFLFVGRDFKRKGGEFLLKAFRIVRRERPDAELAIVGPDGGGGRAGSEMGRVFIEVKSRGRGETIHAFFRGYVPRAAFDL